MATPKISAPNPAAFNSDPVEQIYSRGVLDRDMSGLAFMLANAAQDRGTANQQQYMQGVQAANQQAMQLAQQEMQAERMNALLKGALDLAKNGYQPANMPVLGQLFNDVNAADVREPSSAANALLRAQAAAALAKAAGGGGGGGGENDTVALEVDPLGNVSGKLTGKAKGGPVDLQKMQERARILQQMLRQGGALAPQSIESANKSAELAARKRYPGVQ